MNKTLRLLGLVGTLLMCGSGAASAQVYETQRDPRQMALDIYGGIKREIPVATIGMQLGQLIQLYRFRCTRVTDYQLYNVRANLIDIKVKCSGDPLYGVTVASNGYVAVYGGNGIVSGLDRRDALIYSFSADGALDSDSRVTVNEALDDTISRLENADEYNLMYMAGLMALAGAIAIGGTFIWLKAWRQRKGRPRKRRNIEPLRRTAAVATSAAKDILMLESTRVMRNILKHPSGIFIAQGRRGKRRFFSSIVWAFLYTTLGWKLFQAQPPRVDEDALQTAREDNQA